MKLRAVLSLHWSFHKWGSPKIHHKVYPHLYRYPPKEALNFEIQTSAFSAFEQRFFHERAMMAEKLQECSRGLGPAGRSLA